MINVYDVRPVDGQHISWDQFYGNLSNLLTTVEDREHSVVMCRDLPDEWQPEFEALGQDKDTQVAWVRFDHPKGHFHMAFIAWDQKVLIDYVNHVGEEIMGGEMTSFVETTPKPTLH